VNFGWRKLSSVFGTIYVPIAIVEVQNFSGEWQEFEFKVDSGAIVTLMNSDDCSLLGYCLKDGEEKTLTTANNSELKVYIHKIGMKITDNMFPTKARIAFAEKQVHSLLLGRLDIFNSFDIHMQGRVLQTIFNYVA
jgi:hypothetical protein